MSIFLVYAVSAIWVFDHIENKHTLCREEDCMKRFEKNFENLEKKKMLPLIKKELKLHQDVTECYISGKGFLKKVC